MTETKLKSNFSDGIGEIFRKKTLQDFLLKEINCD